MRVAAFGADAQSLLDAVAGLARATAALTEALEEADAASRRLHGLWDGEAADAHLDAHARWSGDAAGMNAALARMRAALAGARGNYAASGAANAGMWG